MYLPTLTNEELLRYASTLPSPTPLEAELIKRLNTRDTELAEQIADAEAEADRLRVDLADAQDEIIELKAKVSSLEKQLEDDFESLA